MKDCCNCKHKECWEYADPCDSCTDIDHTGKPTNWEAQTHADRIRAMTDEELAIWLTNFASSTVTSYAEARVAMYRGRLTEWLKETV